MQFLPDAITGRCGGTADAQVLGTCVLRDMWVQIPPTASHMGRGRLGVAAVLSTVESRVRSPGDLSNHTPG